MDSSSLGLIELLLVVGIVVAFAVHELVALRRISRKDRDRE